MSKYQLLPPLSAAEYEALREDIAVAGVLVPIDVDEHGDILDGHHRKQACDDLGIECPTRTVTGIPDFAKADYALTVNLARRHLDQAQRRQLVWNSVKDAPHLGDRLHARRCGVSPTTVAKVREDLKAADQVSSLDTSRTGSDGKVYAKKPSKEGPKATAASVAAANTGRAAGELAVDEKAASAASAQRSPTGDREAGQPAAARSEASSSAGQDPETRSDVAEGPAIATTGRPETGDSSSDDDAEEPDAGERLLVTFAEFMHYLDGVDFEAVGPMLLGADLEALHSHVESISAYVGKLSRSRFEALTRTP